LARRPPEAPRPRRGGRLIAGHDARSLRSGADLLLGTLATSAATAVAALGALFPFFVARLLGREALGTYAVAWGTADILSKFGILGLEQTTVSLAAAHRARGDVAGVRRLLQDALRIGLGLTLAVCVVATAFIGWLGPRLMQPPDLVRAMQIMLLALPGVALYRICNGLSRGLGFMRHDILSGGLAENGVAIASLLALVAAGIGTYAPVLAATCGFTAGGVAAFWLARRGLGHAGRATARAHAAAVPARSMPDPERHLVRYSALVGAYALLNLLLNRLDVLMLGWFVGRVPGLTAATLGVYAAAAEVAGVPRKVRQALEPAFIAGVAADTSAHAELTGETLARGARWMAAVLLPVVGVLALAPTVVLRLFGRDFTSGAAWLPVLVLAHGIASWAGLGEAVLLVRRPSWNLVNSASAVAVMVLVSFLLIPRHGPLGAALGSLAAMTLLASLRLAELSRFALAVPLAAMWRPVAAFAAAAAAAIPVRLLAGELAAGLVLLAGYAAASVVIGPADEDRALLRHLRSRDSWGRGDPAVAPTRRL
jgi:O-antigen/teichoic acid export membrane protein